MAPIRETIEIAQPRCSSTLELDFEGHGLAGKVLLPLVRAQAREQVPKDQQRLQERLEGG